MRISCFKPHTSSLEHRLSVTNLILKPKQICLWSYHQDFFFKLVKAPSKATEDLLQLKTNQLCASRDSFSWCHITKSNRSHTLRKALPSQTGADILCHIILKTHFIQKNNNKIQRNMSQLKVSDCWTRKTIKESWISFFHDVATLCQRCKGLCSGDKKVESKLWF